MKTVIDIGSNSVRLMICDRGTVKKEIITTRLSENLFFTGELSEQAMRRTADAVKALAERARAVWVRSPTCLLRRPCAAAETAPTFWSW